MVSCANATCSTSTDLTLFSYPEEIGSRGLSSPALFSGGRRGGRSCLGEGQLYVNTSVPSTLVAVPALLLCCFAALLLACLALPWHLHWRPERTLGPRAVLRARLLFCRFTVTPLGTRAPSKRARGAQTHVGRQVEVCPGIYTRSTPD